MSRSSISSTLAGAFLVCLSLIAPAFALTITKGPYLQDATPAGMVVMWETSEASDSRVDFGPTASYTHNVYDAALTQSHEVPLTGLTTDSLYHYKVTSHTATAISASADNTLQTAPAYATPFRFVAYGDSRSYPEIHAGVVAGIVAAAPRMVVHTGDFTNTGNSAADWQTDFFRPAEPLIKNTPLFPVLGNHENNSALYYQYFSTPPGGGDNGEEWYAFDYGNAHFIVLDTNVTFAPGSEQYLWLENELKTATAEWLFVVEHHPAYSSGDHGSDPDVQNYLVPLYETYGVDMVFCGHDHLYERSLKSGIYYIVTGGGSGPLSTPNTTSNPYQQFVESANHYCTMDINGDTAVLEAHYPDGTIFDTVTLSHTLPPTANFAATLRSGVAPLSVAFTDASTGSPTSWNWDFGDGGTSTAQNPTHQYTLAGTYTVKLTATNRAGSNNVTKAAYITVTAPITYTLTINVTGSGSVIANPTPGPYASGAQVALTATPASGWKFSSWTGPVANATAASTTITMSANQSVTAQFARIQQTLTVTANPTNGGSVSGGGTYNQGDTATVTATPASGWKFSSWTGPVANATAATTTVTMSANQSVTAQFARIQHTLTVAANPTNGGSVSGGGTYNQGDTATVTATPASGWKFTSWIGPVANATAATTTVTMSANQSVTAQFARIQQTLTVTANPTNGGSVSGGGTYNQGDTATVTAIPNSGWKFNGWSGAVANVSVASTTVVMTASKIVIAQFVRIQQTLTATANPTTGGSVSGGGDYNQGDTATVTASPKSGWKFGGWSGSVADPNAPSTTVTMDTDKSVTAQFISVSLPKTPSNLAAAAYSMSQIRLTWTDNAINETGFKIEARLGKSGVWSQIDTAGADETTFLSDGLLAGATYSYRVRAYNDLGDGKYSKSKTGKTFALPAPGNLIATPVSANQINLTWGDNSSDELGFKIERRLAGSAKWSKLKTLGPNITSYSNTGLKTATQYVYRVRAYKSTGYSDYSNEAGGMTL
jgi:PKD repeat protein